jgi:adenylate kinase
MNTLLFGPPGSGKGTQAKDVSASLGVPHVATGDIFRRHLKEGTELGQLARSYMDRGALVPDSVTCDLVASRLLEADASGGVLFDGFPRSVPQAEWLVRWLEEHGRPIRAVVNLLVPDSALVERISGRRSCVGCGATYHVVYAPSARGARCASCDAELVQRADDREDVVLHRLATYHRETAPVLGVLRAAGATVFDIDGLGAVDAVRARIFAALRLG